MTDTSGSEPQTSEIPKAETDCDAGATIQGSSASPSIASASETSVSSISSSGANAGSLTVEQPKKSASLSGVTDLPKLTGSTTTAEASKTPSAAKPCPSSTSKTGVTPTSELNAPSATPSGAR